MFLFNWISTVFSSSTTFFGLCLAFVAYTMHNSSEHHKNKENVSSINSKHIILKGELNLNEISEVRKPKTKEVLFYAVPVNYIHKGDTNKFIEYFYEIPRRKNIAVLVALQEPYFVTANIQFYEKNIQAKQTNIAFTLVISAILLFPGCRKLYKRIRSPK